MRMIMRLRDLVGVLMILGACVAPVVAQPLVYPALNYGVPPNQAVMNLDYPAQGAFLDQPHIYFAGWAFNCAGHPINNPELWVYVPGGKTGGDFRKWPTVVTQGLYRPDVRAHYESVNSPCVVDDYSGWHLYPTKALPEGAQVYFVQVYVSGGYFLEGSGAIMSSSASVYDRWLISFLRPPVPFR